MAVTATARHTTVATLPDEPGAEVNKDQWNGVGAHEVLITGLGTAAEAATTDFCQSTDARLSDSRSPSGAAGGNLSGTYPNPMVDNANGLIESAGPNALAMGNVPDNTFLKRSGFTLIGATPATPAHAASHNAGGSDAMAIDSAAATGSLRTLGSASTQACAGNDSRLSDSRTPTAHAASHKSGGSDPIKLDEFAAPTDVTTLNASTLAHGLLPKLAGGTTTFLRADGTYATPTATAADPSYSPGSVTVATETSHQVGPHIKFTGSQRLTIQGTARLSLQN
jgi:hypothetical protein